MKCCIFLQIIHASPTSANESEEITLFERSFKITKLEISYLMEDGSKTEMIPISTKILDSLNEFEVKPPAINTTAVNTPIIEASKCMVQKIADNVIYVALILIVFTILPTGLAVAWQKW